MPGTLKSGHVRYWTSGVSESGQSLPYFVAHYRSFWTLRYFLTPQHARLRVPGLAPDELAGQDMLRFTLGNDEFEDRASHETLFCRLLLTFCTTYPRVSPEFLCPTQAVQAPGWSSPWGMHSVTAPLGVLP